MRGDSERAQHLHDAREPPLLSRLPQGRRSARSARPPRDVDGARRDVRVIRRRGGRLRCQPAWHMWIVRPASDFIECGTFGMLTGRKHDGKPDNVIIGRLKGEGSSAEHSYRYPMEEWTTPSAQSHCREHDGTFEVARRRRIRRPPIPWPSRRRPLTPTTRPPVGAVPRDRGLPAPPPRRYKFHQDVHQADGHPPHPAPGRPPCGGEAVRRGGQTGQDLQDHPVAVATPARPPGRVVCASPTGHRCGRWCLEPAAISDGDMSDLWTRGQ